jgi:hypothetical protein
VAQCRAGARPMARWSSSTATIELAAPLMRPISASPTHSSAANCSISVDANGSDGSAV